MFHTVLPCSASKLLNSLQFFETAILLPCNRDIADYANLTQNPTFHARYIVAVRPTATSNAMPTQSDPAQNEQSQHFVSGWAGTINYPDTPQSQIGDISLYHFSYSILIDTEQDLCVLQSPTDVDPSELHALENDIQSVTSRNAPTALQRKWQAQWTQAQYSAAFTKVKDYLSAGDCYQVNLAMPFVCSEDIRHINPYPLLEHFKAPYSCYLKEKTRTVISVTPELFLAIRNNRLETRPIKGTTPRSPDPETDESNRQLLIGSKKNQAENLMIVDLLRNDLSKSAAAHSVKVEKLFNIESHKNVHHMVSTITATLKSGLSASGAISAAFPGGSITGAPKRRAMEIINELEPEARGAYCGSFGYIDDTGSAEFNILIRTIEATENRAICWGGGGIVMDSTVDDEYQEILNKVGMILSFPL